MEQYSHYFSLPQNTGCLCDELMWTILMLSINLIRQVITSVNEVRRAAMLQSAKTRQTHALDHTYKVYVFSVIVEQGC